MSAKYIKEQLIYIGKSNGFNCVVELTEGVAVVLECDDDILDGLYGELLVCAVVEKHNSFVRRIVFDAVQNIVVNARPGRVS